MPLMRLKSGGELLPTDGVVKDGELHRSAIFVHEGEFVCDQGPIEFDEARLKVVAKNMNKFLEDLEAEYDGKLPMGARPPFLDCHSDDSNDRVGGRIMGNFRVERRKVPKVGKNVPCLIGDICFLGAETIEKVQDGRIYYLSVGIDETNNMLGEISGVVDPAADGAMLLSKQKNTDTLLAAASSLADNNIRGIFMPKSIQKRLAANKARISTIKGLLGETDKLTTLAAAAKGTSLQMVAVGKVTARLSGLMKSGKLTPAGYKKLDIKKLSALDDSTLDIVLGAIDANEPVIEPGQRGSAAAANASDLRMSATDAQFKRLKDEARSDVYKKLGRQIPRKHLAKGEEGYEEQKESVDDKVSKKMAGAAREVEGGDQKKMGEFKKCLAALEASVKGGDKSETEKQMAALKGFGDDSKMGLGDMMGDTPGAMEAQIGVQEQIDALNVNLSKVVDCLKVLLAEEEAEGQEMAAEGGEVDPATGEPAAPAPKEGAPPKPAPEPKTEPDEKAKLAAEEEKKKAELAKHKK